MDENLFVEMFDKNNEITKEGISSYVEEIKAANRHVFSIVGAHGVGKTTMVYKLRNILKDVSIMNEVVRDIPFTDEINHNQTANATFWIHDEHIVRLLRLFWANLEADRHIILCDRSEYDPYLYLLNLKQLEKIIDQLRLYYMPKKVALKPYHQHIILLDDTFNNDAKFDTFRDSEPNFFLEKRKMFFEFYTKCFQDILIINRSTDIRQIADWINSRAQ